MPDDVTAHQRVAKIRLNQVLSEWEQHAKGQADEVRCRPLVNLLRDECGDVPVDEFGPRKPDKL